MAADAVRAQFQNFHFHARGPFLRELHRSMMPGCWYLVLSSSDYWEDTGEQYNVSIINDQVRSVRHVPTERDMFGRPL